MEVVDEINACTWSCGLMWRGGNCDVGVWKGM